MRRIIAGLLAVAALSFAAGGALAQTKLTLGFPPNSDLDPLFMAKEKGLLEKHGLDTTFKIIPLPPNIPPALVSGSIDIGTSSPTTMLQAYAAGLDLVAIFGASHEDIRNPRIVLVARKDSNIHSAKDLIGKKVGMPGVGSSTDLFLRAWLKKNGVDPAQITRIEMPLPQAADLLKLGSIDAATVVEPFSSKVIDSGAGYLVSNYYTEVDPDTLSYFWVTTRKWAEGHKAEIKAFRDAYAEGLKYGLDHKDELAAAQQKYIGLATQKFSTFSLALQPKDFEIFAKLAYEAGLLKQPLTPADLDKLVFKTD